MAYIRDESVKSFHYSTFFGIVFTLFLFVGIVFLSVTLLMLAAVFAVIWFVMIAFGMAGIEDAIEELKNEQ